MNEPMSDLLRSPEAQNAHQVSPLVLAYLGDSIHDLLVRSWLVGQSDAGVRMLHKRAVGYVCAAAQATALERIWDRLEEEERAVVRRGRNARSPAPRHADEADYHQATGLEALFGWLYLAGREERLRQIFAWTMEE